MVDRAGVLGNAPLVFVVCGVTFRSRESMPAWIGAIQERVYQRFPVLARVHQRSGPGGIEISVDPAEFDDSQVGSSFVFMSEDRSRGFQLWKGGVVLQSKAYGKFNDFCDDLQCVLDALLASAQHLDVETFGIRYVDHIRPEFSDDDLSQYISKELLPYTPAWSSFPGELQGGSSRQVYSVGDAGLHVRVVTGASAYVIADDLLAAYIATVTPSESEESPVPRLRFNEGVLDIDAFKSGLDWKIEGSTKVAAEVRVLHDLCNDYFRNICSDKAFIFWKEVKT
ncbi:TIGR04255 family protein [Stenotrophomonas sp.]|uniref:TIGR04255 family protein n=1 Tax=Stenotrophomonas sp. TaxID=69392 RepID=UPI0028A8F27E|nr:TIGR04255 family protein [Stenotrophomonas sp.]